ncbi:unnamed protein product [Linum tenue]|uniref:Pentatricopeptide repeat-containing protein n=3 Tax=Linum tenue TaxID=586396 RepID=A0AAV0PFS4_9ROSI|nr:unnamed protein product [Linum tenue]
MNPRNLNYNTTNPAPLNQFSPYIHDGLVLQVIKSKQLQSNPYHALLFFNWASNPRPNPNHYAHSHRCYAAIVDLLLSHSLFAAASSLLEASNRVSDLTLSKFISANGRLGNVKAAVFWFHRARTTVGVNGDCLFSCNAILGALVRNNRIDLARSIFDQIVQDGRVNPDVSTYTTMITGYCKLGMVEEARKVFDEMPCQPNKVTYNALVNGYCKAGDMDSAKLIFSRMIGGGSGCSPDTITYSILIDGYCKRGEFDESERWLNEMVNRGCIPNLLTYNAIVYSLCLRGLVDEAKKYLTKMRLNGVRENLLTHMSILKGLSVAGKSGEVVRYFREGLREGKIKNPGSKVYAILVREYCKMRKPDEAISVLKEMCNKRIKPNVSCFNSVFRALLEVEKPDAAALLMKQMKKMGCKPNFISYSTVVSGLCTAADSHRMREVEEIVNDMIKDGISMDAGLYSILVLGYCRECNVEMARKFLGEAISNSYVVSLEAFTAFLECVMGEKGEVSDGEKLLAEMCKRCAVLDPASYMQALNRFVLR